MPELKWTQIILITEQYLLFYGFLKKAGEEKEEKPQIMHHWHKELHGGWKSLQYAPSPLGGL